MPVQKYSGEEMSRRGDEIYERVIKPTLRPDQKDHFVAIDIDTEDYEIGADDYATCARVLSRHSNAQLWVVRVGHIAPYRLGWGHQPRGTA